MAARENEDQNNKKPLSQVPGVRKLTAFFDGPVVDADKPHLANQDIALTQAGREARVALSKKFD